MIKRVFILFLLSFSFLNASLLNELGMVNRCVGDINQLNENQKKSLIKAYAYGAPFEMGYILAAISWQESCAGEYKINYQDPSAGMFHVYIPNVLDRYPDMPKTNQNINMIGQILVNNDEFAAREALRELLMWKKAHNGNVKSIVKSYNKGNKWQRTMADNKLAENYYKNVQNYMYQIKNYFDKIKLSSNVEIFNGLNKRASIVIYHKENQKGEKYNLNLDTLVKEMSYFAELTKKQRYFLD